MDSLTGTTRPVLPVLVSYAYGARWDFAAHQRYATGRGLDLRVMADSGAFTAHTTGRPVDLDGYAGWLNRWGPSVFSAACTMDVIGDPAATAANTIRLREQVTGVAVLGVYHCGSPLEVLEAQCAEAGYVALGGAVGLTRRKTDMLRLLVRVHRTARKYGAVVHGLGMTVPPLVTGLPWMSVDSAYWRSAARSGTLRLFDDRSGAWTEAMRVGTRQVHAHADVLRRYPPLSAAGCALPGYALVRERGEQGGREREQMNSATCLSWLRFAARWHATARPVTAPSGAALTGPTLYLAVGGDSELRQVIDGAATDPIWRELAARRVTAAA